MVKASPHFLKFSNLQSSDSPNHFQNLRVNPISKRDGSQPNSAEMGRRRGSTAFSPVSGWVLKQSKKVQASLAAMIGIGTILTVHFFSDSDYFYAISQVIYSIGLLVLVYKLTTSRNCSGLSLRTQEVTAIFLAGRLLCTFLTDFGIELHLYLDFVSLTSTSWVIYMMRFKLQSTYIKELDNMPIYYLVVPCFVLAVLINPSYGDTSWGHPYNASVLWAFCTYMESVSVLPQLRLIQNAKMVEPFTAHYVFALGLARFFGFAHWVFIIYETGGSNLINIGGLWYLWIPMYLLAELVQTFILADFCYYYTQSVMRGQKMVLPSPV